MFFSGHFELYLFNLIAKSEDGHLFVRLWHSLCFSLKTIVFMYVVFHHIRCSGTADSIMNDWIDKPLILGRHNYNLSNTKKTKTKKTI